MFAEGTVRPFSMPSQFFNVSPGTYTPSFLISSLFISIQRLKWIQVSGRTLWMASGRTCNCVPGALRNVTTSRHLAVKSLTACRKPLLCRHLAAEIETVYLIPVSLYWLAWPGPGVPGHLAGRPGGAQLRARASSSRTQMADRLTQLQDAVNLVIVHCVFFISALYSSSIS